MWHLPVLEEHLLSTQSGDGIQDQGRVTGIRGRGRFRIRFVWVHIWVGAWTLERSTLTICLVPHRTTQNDLLGSNREMLGCHGFQCHEFICLFVCLFVILTIEGLDAVDIITGQNVGVGVSVSLVDWVHQSAHVVGVGQAHGVTELMGSHHEQVVPFIEKIQHYRLALAVEKFYFVKNTWSSRNVHGTCQLPSFRWEASISIGEIASWCEWHTSAWTESEGLILIKVGVSSNVRGRGKCVRQDAFWAIEGVEITMLCGQDRCVSSQKWVRTFTWNVINHSTIFHLTDKLGLYNSRSKW